LQVTPVATSSGAAGVDAVIPITVQGEGSSAEAVIPVEVPTKGKPPRKRAALIPIAVQRHAARRRMRGFRNKAHRARSTSPVIRPILWKTVVGDAAETAIEIETAAMDITSEWVKTGTIALRFLLYPFLGAPAERKTGERSARFPQHSQMNATRVAA
jgi:hypothetical protein